MPGLSGPQFPLWASVSPLENKSVMIILSMLFTQVFSKDKMNERGIFQLLSTMP